MQDLPSGVPAFFYLTSFRTGLFIRREDIYRKLNGPERLVDSAGAIPEMSGRWDGITPWFRRNREKAAQLSYRNRDVGRIVDSPHRHGLRCVVRVGEQRDDPLMRKAAQCILSAADNP